MRSLVSEERHDEEHDQLSNIRSRIAKSSTCKTSAQLGESEVVAEY